MGLIWRFALSSRIILTGRRRRRIPASFFATEIRNGVRIRRSFAYILSQISSLKRILHEGSFTASTLAVGAFCKRPDILLVVSPPPGLALRAIVLDQSGGDFDGNDEERIAAKGVPKDKIALIEPPMDESLSSIILEEGLAFRKRFGMTAGFWSPITAKAYFLVAVVEDLSSK